MYFIDANGKKVRNAEMAFQEPEVLESVVENYGSESVVENYGAEQKKNKLPMWAYWALVAVVVVLLVLLVMYLLKRMRRKKRRTALEPANYGAPARFGFRFY